MLENFAGCADTPAKKREVTQRLLRAWQRAPELRLGQLIDNAFSNDIDGVERFFAEDFDFVVRVEAFVDRYAAQKNEDSQ